MKKLKDAQGFTIIEVMIVLVIAAVILLIVFLAVPALQRTSRNNQRKSDASRVNSAVAEYVSNSGGSLPTDTTSVLNIAGTLAFYDNANITLVSGAKSTPPALTKDQMQIDTGAVCSTTALGDTVAGTSRQYAIRFATETASGQTAACING